MEWVASDNNISDKISRHDLAMAKKFGWQEVAIDMDPFYQILLRASEDDDYVLGGALQDLVAFGASASFFKGTGNVAGGRPSAVWKGWPATVWTTWRRHTNKKGPKQC